MAPFDTFAILLTVAAAFAYVNHRWLRLPTSIGLMSIALGVSILFLLLDRTGLVGLSRLATRVVEGLPLERTLLQGALGMLLFAISCLIKWQPLIISPFVCIYLLSAANNAERARRPIMNRLRPFWAAALVVFVLFIALAGLTGYVGYKKLDLRGPTRSINSLKETMRWAKARLLGRSAS